MEQVSRPMTLKFGPYVVDLAAGEVRKNGSRIRLQEKPLRVLALLAEKQGQLVTREELQKKLWPEDTFVDFETGLNTAVSKLRDALSDEADHPRYIETIPRRGYRFLIPVEKLPANGAAAHAPSAGLTDHQPLSQGETPPAAEPPVPAPSAPPALPQVPTVQSRGRHIFPAVLTVLLVVSISALAIWYFQGRSALSFNSHDSVLIADFENQTGDPRFDKALATAFVVSIEQSRYANVFPRNRLDEVLARMGKSPTERITPALGREICQRENIRGLLACSITRTGQEYALTAELMDPRTGETVRSYTEHAHGEDQILSALDTLSQKTREALGESLYHIHQASKPLPEVTTSSLTALQQYAEGSTFWHHGNFPEAFKLFQAAVSSDPNFAMAHAALGRADYSYITNAPVAGEEEYKKALALSDHVTDRERMLIQLDYAADRVHFQEADALYRSYLERYPEDFMIRFDYANLLRKNQRDSDSIQQYQQVLRSAPDYAHAYIGIATAEKELGKYPEALAAYAEAFQIEPQWLTAGNINREYGFALVANGEDQKAEQVFSALLDKPGLRENGLRSLAFLDLYHGRYRSAESRLQQSLAILNAQSSSPFSQGRIHLLLAVVAGGEGDKKGQRQSLDAALSQFDRIQVKVIFGAMLGDAYARAGWVDQAQKLSAIITPLADKSSFEQMGYLHLLDGEIALAQGKSQEALELLMQSEKENKNGYSIEAVAHAWQQSGDLTQAIAAYEGMLQSTESSLGWEPQQRWLEARLTLALDYAARGDKQKARETLEALLNLWRDADPDLPLLKRAKAEYAKLQ